MFTGLIEGKGFIKKLLPQGQGFLIEIESDFSLEGSKIGDSIAVDGICLTITSLSSKRFTAQVSPETIARTTLKFKKAGDLVNLERALRLGDPLGGHLVSGHIDCLGKITKIQSLGEYYLLEIEAPKELAFYLVPKGSIALDGISLTINNVVDNFFSLMIIPHTYKVTTLSHKKVGDYVNLEIDLIAKLVYKWVKPYLEKLEEKEGESLKEKGLMKLLEKTGFL